MAQEAIDPSERISVAFTKLTESAKNINDVSNELAKPIAAMQIGLKKLNIGVACWTNIQGGTDQFEDAYWSNDVGYARVKGEWSLAIRSVNGILSQPDAEMETVWPFNEAPRHLRIKAVDLLPTLIEDMVQATDATTKRMGDKVPAAQSLAQAVAKILSDKTPKPEKKA